MSDPTTDAKQCKIYLDPVMLEAVDANRKDRTRPEEILRVLAKQYKLKNYKPRGRGRPKKGE